MNPAVPYRITPQVNPQSTTQDSPAGAPGSCPVNPVCSRLALGSALWGHYGFGAGSLPSRIIIPYLACTYRPAGDRHRVTHRVHHTSQFSSPTIVNLHSFTHSSTVVIHLLYTTQEPQDVLHRVSLWGIQRRLNRVSNLTG